MIRVVIADDQELVLAGISAIVDDQNDMTVVGSASNGEELLRVVAQSAPDLALVDIRMPGMDGLEATRRLLAGPPPHPRVVVLTTFDADGYVYEALRLGASGYLLKDAPRQQLVEGLRAAARGEMVLAPAITERLVATFVGQPRASTSAPLQNLSDRETEVLRLVALGLANREIAERLFVSEATVKTHVARVQAKLGLRDRIHAVLTAYETGLVRLGERP